MSFSVESVFLPFAELPMTCVTNSVPDSIPPPCPLLNNQIIFMINRVHLACLIIGASMLTNGTKMYDDNSNRLVESPYVPLYQHDLLWFRVFDVGCITESLLIVLLTCVQALIVSPRPRVVDVNCNNQQVLLLYIVFDDSATG